MRNTSIRNYGAAIFSTSWIVRLALIGYGHPYLAPVNPHEAVLVAKSLAAGQGFSNPYGCVTGPTAHLAPVYPFLLSLIDRIVPAGASRELTIYLFSTCIASLAWALLPWLAARLRLDRRAGVVAGFAGALIPLYFWIEVTSEWDTPLDALLIVVTLGFFIGLFESPTVRRAVGLGLVCGFVLLTFPTALTLFAALSVALLWRRRERFSAAVRPIAALWIVALAVVAPWTIRNYRVFHEFIFVRGNAGLELHTSYNGKAGVSFEETSAKGGYADHPHASLQVCAEWARYGEVAMNGRLQRDAEEWVRAHPREAVTLFLRHVAAFWYLVPGEMPRSIATGLVCLLGWAGVFVCWRRGNFVRQLPGIVLVIYPLLYYVPRFDIRYRYPVFPLIVLLGSAAVLEVSKRLFGHGFTRMHTDKTADCVLV